MPGNHEINGDAVFALVSNTPSRAPESGQFEAHQKYIDIQYVISGEEFIGVAPTKELQEVTAYDSAKDIAFYANPSEFENVEMQPGRFVVFFPENAHLPLCHCRGKQQIHKVVIKLRVDHWKACRKAR